MTVTEKDLLHHRFALKTIDGKTLSPEIEIDPYIEFNEGFNVSGRTCNQFRGKGELKDGVLTIGQMASTMMFCAFGELNELEKMFSAMMKEGAAITLADNVLTLSQGGHVLVYELRDLVN